MKLPRLFFWIGGLAAIGALLLVVVALLLPRLLDSQLIRDKISSELVKKSGENLSFGKISFQWFPRPVLSIENVRLTIDDSIVGSIQTARIYPSIFHLLTGRWQARLAQAQQARLRIRLTLGTAQSLDRDTLEKQLRAGLIALTRQLPAPRIELIDGSAAVAIADHPPLNLFDVAGDMFAAPSGLRFKLSSRSNDFERLSIAGEIAPESLAAQLEVSVRKLKIGNLLAWLPQPVVELAPQGEASVDVAMTSVGLVKFNSSVNGSTGPIVLARYDPATTIGIKQFKAGIVYDDGRFQLDVERLDLASPKLNASGQLTMDAGSLLASIKLRDFAVAPVGGLALQLAGDGAAIKKILRYVPAGTITEMNIQSAGRSWSEMALSKNIVVTSRLRDGKISIPGPDLDFTNVTASIRLADEVLEAKEIKAQLGTAKGWDGDLRLGLSGPSAPFHLAMEVQAAAPELQTILLKLVADETFHEELLKLQKLEGELTGRLILGETLAALSPVVTVSKADISATYSPVSLPIKIHGARFTLDSKRIRLENAQGSVGRSSFARLGVIWRRDGSRQFKVDSGPVSLHLQQCESLLRSVEKVRPSLPKFHSIDGHIELQNLTLSGAFDEPSSWIWAGMGRAQQVEIERPEFPQRIILARGKFSFNQRQILFSETAVSLSDASFIADGTVDYKSGEVTGFAASGTGSIGRQMNQWLDGFFGAPEDVRLRSPLIISAAKFAWYADGDISFAGRITVADGPQLSVEMVKPPEGFVLSSLIIEDGRPRTQLALEIGRERIKLSFNGAVTPQTIDKLFLSPSMKGVSLRGKIELIAARVAPAQFSAYGELSGSNLELPLGGEKIAWKKFTIAANGEELLIRSAELGWRDSRLSLAGKVGAGKDVLRLDLTMSGDRLSFAELDRLFSLREKESGKVIRKESLPRLEGILRLKLDRFATEKFILTGLQLRSEWSASSIKAELERGVVCGIDTSGRMELLGQDIRLDLQLAAKDADLEPATACLTDRRSDIKGTYTFNARLTAAGDRTRLRSSLKGAFDFNARDGALIRAEAVDTAFDYLNESGDFAVVFPDLDKEAVAYQQISAKGTVDGEKVITDEIVIRATPYTITGQGNVDLQHQQVDLKGLVSVALPAQRVIKRIPIIGPIMSGSVVGIPLRVNGSFYRPQVTYMAPADVGGELINVPMRILGTPLDAIKLFVPNKDNSPR